MTEKAEPVAAAGSTRVTSSSDLQGSSVRWLSTLGLAAASSAVLLFLTPALTTTLARPTSAVVLLALAAGAWPGLLAFGHVADALLAPVDKEARARILNDRHVGTFGAGAITLSLLVQLSTVLHPLSPLMVALAPVVSAAIGLLADGIVSGEAIRNRLGGLVALVALEGAMIVFVGASAALMAAVAVILAVWLRNATRHGARIAPLVAGHGALIVALILATFQ